MNYNYSPFSNVAIRHEIDPYLLLAAAIVEHLKEDATMWRGIKCETETSHAVRDCARQMLLDLREYRVTNPDADHIELATEIMRLHLIAQQEGI